MPENPRPEPSRLYRWLVLIFVSLAMFGSYYAYDALSPIADVLKQQLGFSDLDIGFLQAIYSFPNIFTVLIGGFIIDRIGLRKSLMIFALLCFIGPAITAASGRLPVMATGRLIFGMGPGSLAKDARMMGLDSLEVRRMMEESLEAMTEMLKYEGPVSRKTDWFTLDEAVQQWRPWGDRLDLRVAQAGAETHSWMDGNAHRWPSVRVWKQNAMLIVLWRLRDLKRIRRN